MIQKQLGQTQTAADTATSIYSPGAGVEATNLMLTIANNGAADSFRVYQDDDGTTYSTATALHYDVAIAANTTVKLPIGPMSNSSGNLAVSSTTANRLTFTLHGIERLIA